jgi:hypothetical protein
MPTSLRPPKALLSRLRSWSTRSGRPPITPSPSSLGSQQGSHGVLDSYLLRVLDNYLPGKKWVDGRDIYVLDYLSTQAERYPNSAMSLRAITRGKKGVENGSEIPFSHEAVLLDFEHFKRASQ